jgi:hypothetical protein
MGTGYFLLGCRVLIHQSRKKEKKKEGRKRGQAAFPLMELEWRFFVGA